MADYLTTRQDADYDFFSRGRIPSLLDEELRPAILDAAGAAKVYYLSNIFSYDKATESLYLILESYSYYASRQYNLATPVFTRAIYDDEDSNIDFHAFIITDKKNNVQAVVIYDNYETLSVNDFKLRFVWWYPCTVIESHSNTFLYEGIQKIKEEIYDILLRQYYNPGPNPPRCWWLDKKLPTAITTPKDGQYMVHDKSRSLIKFEDIGDTIFSSRVIPFNESPITTTTAQLNLVVFDSYSEKLINDCFLLEDEKFTPYPLYVFKKANLEKLELVKTDPSFDCFLMHNENKQSEFVELFNLYSKYLKQERGYDFTYQLENQRFDVFLVVNKEHTSCIGVFAFILKEHRDDINCHEIGINKKLYETIKLELTQVFPILGSVCKPVIFDDLELKINLNTHLFRLEVAWIHPFHRRQGMLKSAWVAFMDRYSIFDVDMPSPAMQCFLTKHNKLTSHIGSQHFMLTLGNSLLVVPKVPEEDLVSTLAAIQQSASALANQEAPQAIGETSAQLESPEDRTRQERKRQRDEATTIATSIPQFVEPPRKKMTLASDRLRAKQPGEKQAVATCKEEPLDTLKKSKKFSFKFED